MIGVAAGALDGIRVVEMGQLIAGPFCGQLLGDLGADVIKIEPPRTGDPMRNWGRGEQALWWEVIARNKRSVSIDLRTPEGQALARELIGEADILVENFRPGTLEKWGLSPDRLMADNPRLIIARMSGYGQDGPYSERAGFGVIGEAMGGWRYINGTPGQPQSRMGVSIGDSLCATYGALGALAALERRHRTGRGQIIDTSLYESVLQVMESLVIDYSVTGYVRERSGSILPGIAPSNVYQCSDGDFLIGGNGDGVFTRMSEAMGMPQLATDPRFNSHLSRGEHQQALDDIINGWTRNFTVAEVEALMNAHGVPAGRMYRAAEMLADPHFKARQSIVEVDHPVLGAIHMQGVFPKLSETPGSIRRTAPAHPGADNDEVLGEVLAMSPERIAELRAAGTI